MVRNSGPVPPTGEEVAMAKASRRQLAALVARRSKAVEVVAAGKGAQTIRLPASAVQMLVKILTEMSRGNAVTLTAVHAQLTTQQAADLLGVSRPFVVKELKAGKIPYQRVGTHRRILYTDLVTYMAARRRAQDGAMDELVRQSQALGLGY